MHSQIYTALMYSFPDLEPVCCYRSSSDCCFLTCIQASQEKGKVVCYSCLFKNFPQFVVIYTVKGFCIVREAEVDVFLEFSCFFYDPRDVGSLTHWKILLCSSEVSSGLYYPSLQHYGASYFKNHQTLFCKTQKV